MLARRAVAQRRGHALGVPVLVGPVEFIGRAETKTNTVGLLLPDLVEIVDTAYACASCQGLPWAAQENLQGTELHDLIPGGQELFYLLSVFLC